MLTSAATHPSADTLRAFSLGQLDEQTAVSVMNHLDGCAGCQKEVAVVTGDYFLDRLRQVRDKSGTPAPGKSLSELARSLYATLPPTGSVTAPAGLPSELLNHPQYEVLSELGRGGMGVVYLARHRLSGRLEVLKVMNKELLLRSAGKERFLREIQSAALLDHPNVVKMYTALELNDLMVLVIEYVKGEDLAKLVKAKGPLPAPNACFYAQQTALGLQHAHEKKMVHRDIKPQNLILAREGKKHVIKVLDFGLAKVVREGGESFELTGHGQMLGTPDYIAPEQTLDATHADIRADIYSLGCTLYYLLTGHPPFKGKSLFEILLAHQSMEAKPLNQERLEIPEDLAAIVAKMMAKDPAKRFEVPVEVAKALAPFFRADAKRSSTKSLHEPPAGGLAPPSMEADRPHTRQSHVPVAKIIEDLKPEQPAREKTRVPSWDTLTESNFKSSRTGKSGIAAQASTMIARVGKTKTFVALAALAGVLLAGLIGMWAGGVFKGKTKTASSYWKTCRRTPRSLSTALP
ncbi:MAG: protein kinase domain-containing protein [Gemmataceae bacterium]